jgi:hypothetical protein
MDQNPMTPPRKFFQDFVLRSYREFQDQPGEEYLAKIAVHHANVMAERMWAHYKSSDPDRVFKTNDASAYREQLEQRECDGIGIIRDIDDAFKHVSLNRRTRRLTHHDQTGAAELRWLNDAGQEIKWMNAGGKPIRWSEFIVVRLDDGSERPLMPMLDEVVAMWDRLSEP